MTDTKPPGHLRAARLEQVAGSTGSGRDTTGGAATGVGTSGTKGTHARQNPAAELGFSGDPGQHGAPDDDMLHAQRVWDGTLATNRLDELGVNTERQRVEIKDVTATVSVLVDGRPEDVRKSVQSVLDHTDVHVLALDLGNVDGAGDVLRELADRYPERITAWHVAEPPLWRGGTSTWGESRMKLLQLDESEVQVLMATDVMLRGDALTPLIAAVVEGAVAAGWKGLEEADGAWREAGPGKVRALGSGLMAVRRAQALTALPEDAEHGTNADRALSLALRGELFVPAETLPVTPVSSHERLEPRPG
ncbi:hypothetical protein SAMN05444920_1047 [Nonomuraea solani]|uniref:Glycosyl transferase family 2 n=1 Tax=Nonomuraea solani TaxID=1144553 RepID=A0A1H6CIK4_9ACTN|nr:hypothetical protein [Nonomuraea solani]SEG72535.1 hypothetical protein SAMN05444920_1047 [Nonomuraea solani]